MQMHLQCSLKCIKGHIGPALQVAVVTSGHIIHKAPNVIAIRLIIVEILLCGPYWWTHQPTKTTKPQSLRARLQGNCCGTIIIIVRGTNVIILTKRRLKTCFKKYVILIILLNLKRLVHDKLICQIKHVTRDTTNKHKMAM